MCAWGDGRLGKAQGGGEVSVEDKSIPSGMAEAVCEDKWEGWVGGGLVDEMRFERTEVCEDYIASANWKGVVRDGSYGNRIEEVLLRGKVNK